MTNGADGRLSGIGDRFEYRNVRVDGDGGRPIVSRFSARIPADGLTAVVGPSGAGKTTLLRLLNRLDDADGGQVFFDGRDVRSYDVLALRRRVQYVGQVPVTFPGTVAENVATGNPGADTAALLGRVGLDPALAGRAADRLSVGEAQRMCLARALALAPECLLLDEPTSALDAGSKEGIEVLVRSLADGGLTVVMVTHDLRQAELADRTVVVDGGTGDGPMTGDPGPSSVQKRRYIRLSRTLDGDPGGGGDPAGGGGDPAGGDPGGGDPGGAPDPSAGGGGARS